MNLAQSNKKQNIRTLFSVGLILLIISQIFFVAIKEKMHQRIPESLDHYAEAMSIAISHKNYNLDGYIGYRSVYDTLIKNGFDWDHHANVSVLNEAINKARFETNTDSEYILFSVGDVGFVDYMRLSFDLFGFKVQSLLYLYMVILLLQVTLFFVSFRSNRLAIVGLILFLLSHYITANGLIGAGYNLWAFHNNRFLPVLGLIPIIHICLLALFQKKLKLSTIAIALIQIVIYIFVLRCRGSALWMCGPIILVGGIWALSKLNLSIFKIIKLNLWPVVLLLSMVIASFLMKPHILNEEYYSENNLASHTFWYPVYVGLAINPEIREFYGPREPIKMVDVVGRFTEVCDEDHSDDSPIKAKARIFVCKNRKIAQLPLVAIRNWNQWVDRYTQNDQDGSRAVFNWLKANGKTEQHLYRFSEEDQVGYPRWFGQCDSIERTRTNDPAYVGLRKYDAKIDFKWREMDRIMGEVVKDAIRNHPLEVIKTILFVKPFFFIVYYFFHFIKLTSVIGFIVIAGSYIYLWNEIKEISKVDMKKLLMVMTGMFICSMVIVLTAYPAKHTISDQSVLLTMSLLGLILYQFKKIKKVKT